MHAARLLAGRTRVRLPRDGGRPRPFFVVEPDANAKHAAAECAAETAAKARRKGIPTAEASVVILQERKLWTPGDEKDLEKLRTDVESLRVAVFERRDRPAELPPVRRSLRGCEEKLGASLARKNSLYRQSVEGVAESARLRAVVACGLRTKDGKGVWASVDRALAERSTLLDAAVVAYLESRPSVSTLRELARTDPWRGTWVCQKESGSPLFARAAADWSPDQLALIQWSRLFDAASQAENGPGEHAGDDDVVDGWLALQAKERAAGERARGLSALTRNEKVANSQHVFVFADAWATKDVAAGEDGLVPPPTPEELEQATAEVLAMNSPQALATMRRRFDALDRKGTVEEFSMPDSLQARAAR